MFTQSVTYSIEYHILRFLYIAFLIALVSLITITIVHAQIQDEVYSLKWSPDGMWIAISGGEKGCADLPSAAFAVRVFDVQSGQITKNLIGMNCTSTSLDWSPDNQKLVAVNTAQSIAYIWDIGTEQLLFSFPLNIQGTSAIIWSPDGNLIAASSPANTVVFSTLTQVKEFFIAYQELSLSGVLMGQRLLVVIGTPEVWRSTI